MLVTPLNTVKPHTQETTTLCEVLQDVIVTVRSNISDAQTWELEELITKYGSVWVECYIRTVKKHLQKVIKSHQRDWGTRFPTFLCAYSASTHDTMGLMPTNLVFRRELHLPCDMPPPDKTWPNISHVADLVDWPTNIWSCSATESKPAATTSPTAWATKKATKYGYIFQLTSEESHPRFNPHERAFTG
jgi:hypothetical protein